MIRPLPLILALTLLQSAFACQVPVFRYALERWNADPFRLQVVYRGELSPSLTKMLLATQGELATKPSPLNLTLETLDVGKLNETQQLSVVGLDQVESWPAFLLHPPESWQNAPPILLDASEQTLQQILHSPARQKCIDDLLAGESAVWFLIESGDAAADDAALALLEASLERAEREIEIPEGVLRAEDLENFSGEVDMDDILRSSIPLKISFKIERLRRDDPAEQVFLKILTGPAQLKADGPVIVPVFGRGRSPGPVAASAVTEERILQACAYLCGACSCQVKSGNPGYDLLFRANWHEHLQEGLVVVDRVLPPLPGVGSLTPSDASKPTTTPPDTLATSEPSFSLWWIGGGILALVLIGGSLILIRNS